MDSDQGSFKKVGTISREDFESLKPSRPKFIKQELPPAPPIKPLPPTPSGIRSV